MNRSARLLAVLAVAAALLSATGCKMLKARDQLNRGVQAYKGGFPEKAIEHFKNAVNLDDKLQVAKLYLATAYTSQYVPGAETPENLSMAQQAVEQYKAVLKDEPQNSTSLKGLAFLYMQMKRFDEAREFYKKSISADPNDPATYYSVGVLDWTAVYKDTADRKSKEGLKVDEEMKGKRDQKLCEDIKGANEKRVDEGLEMLQQAMEKRQDYDDAMIYVNLLYLRKADMACSDPEARAQDKKLSEDWTNKAMDARKRKNEAEAKKGGGGIILDQPSDQSKSK
ncbi:MAG TPA: tetratricopeptide repeat protein [Candidatus Saccharimonadales bacterium]|jgi:tetratricopeptide (TPR) repeat protein|nr:tetratricopeptide repeat protein [Candidatus Saccharimonadales bacterium]